MKQVFRLYVLLGAGFLGSVLLSGCDGNAAGTSSGSSSSSSSSTGSTSSSSSSSNSSSSSSSSSGAVQAICPSTTGAAFETFPRIIPGTVEAEDYDPAGNYDSTSGNTGSAYRTDTNVDIKAVSGAKVVGWMASGEYLEYTVFVQFEDDFDVYIRAGTLGAGRTFTITQCDTAVIESFNVPVIAQWGQFKTWKAGTIHLQPGTQKFRLTMGSLDDADFDWIHIGPYTGSIDPPVALKQ